MVTKKEETTLSFHQKVLEVIHLLKAPKGQKNTFGKYNYRSAEDILEAVKPVAYEHGLISQLTDELVQVGDRYYVKATASISDGENTLSACGWARESETKKGMDDSQITGTASSYARKYAMNGLYQIDDTKDADTNEYAKQSKSTSSSSKNEPKASAQLVEEAKKLLREKADGLNTQSRPLELQTAKAFGVSGGFENATPQQIVQIIARLKKKA